MLVKEWEVENYIEKLSSFCAILVYGIDRGKVKVIVEALISSLKKQYRKQIDIVKPTAENLNNGEKSFLELVNQPSIFHEKVIINIDLDFIKISKEEIIKLKENIYSNSNLIIFESGILKNDSFLVREFKNNNKFLCLACYQDSNKNIHNSINYFAKKYQLKLDHDSVKYLADRLGNDKMITEQEIRKLALYANNEKLSFKALLEGLGDNSIMSIHKITDNFLLDTNLNMDYNYDKIVESGLNFIVVVKSLIKHLQMLLFAKISGKSLVSDIRPPLHFSRHAKIQEQMTCLSIETLENKITDLNLLEKNCKLSPTLSDTLMKKFLISV